MRMLAWIIPLSIAHLSYAGAAEPRFASGPARVALLELFTSEGCSSCPPAEQWLGDLRHDAGLWKRYVPVSFHVTYWDNLGWRDALARPEFTARQKTYAAHWRSATVYTPCFVRNGSEWHPGDAEKTSDDKSGQLTVTVISSGEWKISFLPPSEKREEFDGHIALLGRGIVSRIRAGENNGRTLAHDFVALDLAEGALQNGQTAKEYTAVFRLKAGEVVKESVAIAAWVTRHRDNEPLQATGGDLQ